MTCARQVVLWAALSGLLVAMTVSQSGCKRRLSAADAARERAAAEAADRVDKRLVAADTDFGFALLRELAKAQPQGNVLVSPVSTALALHMAYNGASGETQTAMAKTLQLEGRGITQLAESDRALMAGVSLVSRGVEMGIANSLWVDKSVSLKPDFANTTRAAYGAQIADLDFTAPGAAKTINGWVSKQTHGTIDGIVDDQYLSARQIMLFLANAAWFKGRWADPFKERETHDGVFHTPGGGQKTVPMMSRTDDMPYLETPGLQAVRLGYATKRFTFLVVLPAKTTSLGELCASLTGEKWADWEERLKSRQGTLRLPRFKCTGDTKLKNALSSLGMGIAFDGGRATFGDMSDAPVCLDDVLHRTYMDVNERGTEVAAVTGLPAPMSGPGQEKPFEMTVDRPFLCAVEDFATKSVLFLGAIVEPK